MDKLGRTKMMAVDFSFATLNLYNNVKPSRKINACQNSGSITASHFFTRA